jgi:predicted nucleic acid-binding protein
VNLEVFTSYFVLAEAATVISQYTSLKNTSHFLDVVLSSGMTIFELNHSLFLKGKEIFASQTSKNFRFSDACNIALIKEYNLDAVFSFDKHYKQNGILRVGIDG